MVFSRAWWTKPQWGNEWGNEGVAPKGNCSFLSFQYTLLVYWCPSRHHTIPVGLNIETDVQLYEVCTLKKPHSLAK